MKHVESDLTFKNEAKKLNALFIEDMHEYHILSNTEHFPITYATQELAQIESDRLNNMGIENLNTRVVGIPWRIYLVTWQDNNQ